MLNFNSSKCIIGINNTLDFGYSLKFKIICITMQSDKPFSVSSHFNANVT